MVPDLLDAKRFVAGPDQRLVEGGAVIAGVVDGAGGRSVRERPDHIEAPQGDQAINE